MTYKPTPKEKTAARKLLAAITLRCAYNTETSELFWKQDGRGPTERAGHLVRGKSLLFNGVSVSTERVKWMLANGVPLYPGEILVDSDAPVHTRRAVTRAEMAYALKARKESAFKRGVSAEELPLRYTAWRFPDGSPGQFTTHAQPA